MEEFHVEELSLIDFMRVYETSLSMGDGRHLWDWLNYNEHIKTITEEGQD